MAPGAGPMEAPRELSSDPGQPMSRLRVLPAVGSLLLAVSVSAQPRQQPPQPPPAQTPATPLRPGQQPTFRSAVDLVQVDVVVVDKDGNQVRGLKAADFTLLDRNKPQTIATFEEVSHETSRHEPAPVFRRRSRSTSRAIDPRSLIGSSSWWSTTCTSTRAGPTRPRTSQADRQPARTAGLDGGALHERQQQHAGHRGSVPVLLAAMDTLQGPPVVPPAAPGDRRAGRCGYPDEGMVRAAMGPEFVR